MTSENEEKSEEVIPQEEHKCPYCGSSSIIISTKRMDVWYCSDCGNKLGRKGNSIYIPYKEKAAVKKLLPLWMLIGINVVAFIIGGPIFGRPLETAYYVGIFDAICLLVWGIVWAIRGGGTDGESFLNKHEVKHSELPKTIIILCGVIGLVIVLFTYFPIGMGPAGAGHITMFGIGGALIFVSIITFIALKLYRARRK